MPIVVGQPTAQIPSGDVTSPDGRIRATVMPDAAGVFIRVDYQSMLGQLGYEWPNPFRMTVYRQTADGVVMPVRGADVVSQYGAILHAYDDEVKFGALVTYWAEAPTKSGDEIVETDKVVVKTWEPDGGFTSPGVWIKNLEDPDLSVPARCLDWSAGSWASRNATADIWGGASPAVTTDVRKSYNTKMVVLTKDEDEYQALLAAVDSSVVYIVGLERHRRRTGYYLIGDIAPTRVGRVDSPYDMWEINLIGMDRPSSSGHSLAVPGRSYADRRRAYPTYDQIPYKSNAVRITALTSAASRVYVNDLNKIPVTPGATYTLKLRARLTNAAAMRNMAANMSFWTGTNTFVGVSGPATPVQPGETVTLVNTYVNPLGVLFRPYISQNTAVTGEYFDLISASFVDVANPSVELLKPEDRFFPPNGTDGNWDMYTNASGLVVPYERRNYGAGTEPY